MCNTAKELNDHLEQHVKQEPWECLWSGCSAMVEKKRWMYRSSLLQHMSSHVPDYRPVGCPFCDFRAAFQWRMAAHIRRKHADCKNNGSARMAGTAASPAGASPGTSSSSSNSGSTPTAMPLLFDGMPLPSLLAGPLMITTLPGDDSTPVFIRPATPPPQPPQGSAMGPPHRERVPLLPRIEALDRMPDPPPPAAHMAFVPGTYPERSVTVHVKSNVDALPPLFRMILQPSLTVAQFLSWMHDRCRARAPGQAAFHLSLARAPFGNVRHHVSIPLCKYETPVAQLLQPNDHLMLCAVAPQE